MADEKLLSATLADSRIKQGRALIKAGRIDDAIEYFGGILEVSSQAATSEDDLSLAPLYLEYGSCLLSKAEEDSSGAAVFGEATRHTLDEREKTQSAGAGGGQASGQGTGDDAEGGQSGAEDDQSGGEEEGSDREGEQAGQQEAGEADGEESEPASLLAALSDPEKIKEALAEADADQEEDLEIAWESLEAARTILAKHDFPLAKELLSKAYTRLADLNNLNSNFAAAIEDFTSSLQLRQLVLPSDDRRIADTHCSLGVAYFYLSNTEGMPGEEQDQAVEKSLEHYEAAATIMAALISKLESKLAAAASAAPVPPAENQENTAPASSSKGKGKAAALVPVASGPVQTVEQMQKDLEDFRDILDTIQETITTTRSGEDRQALERPLAAAAGGGVTTMGFAAPVTTIGFGAPAGGSSSGSATTLLPKAKKPATSSGASATTLLPRATIPAATTSEGFGPTSSSASASQAAPMIVQARKKRPAGEPAQVAGAPADKKSKSSEVA